MYRLIQFIRHKIPFIWNLIDCVNASVFRFQYGKKLKAIPEFLAGYNYQSISFSLAQIEDIQRLIDFFKRQPTDAFEYFNPHGFDKDSILQLIKNPAFIMILAEQDAQIVGYAFLRCFMNGKSFRGKIVDINHRGLGIAKNFGIITTEIASKLGIGLFGTISKSNVSSLASSKSSNNIKIIKELPDDFLFIQYLPKL